MICEIQKSISDAQIDLVESKNNAEMVALVLRVTISDFQKARSLHSVSRLSKDGSKTMVQLLPIVEQATLWVSFIVLHMPIR